MSGQRRVISERKELHRCACTHAANSVAAQLNRSFVEFSQSACKTTWDELRAEHPRPGSTQRFKNDYTKAVPSPALHSALSCSKIKAWSRIWWCHTKFTTAFSLLQRHNPSKSFIFLSTPNTHTHTRRGTTTSRVNERRPSADRKPLCRHTTGCRINFLVIRNK